MGVSGSGGLANKKRHAGFGGLAGEQEYSLGDGGCASTSRPRLAPIVIHDVGSEPSPSGSEDTSINRPQAKAPNPRQLENPPSVKSLESPTLTKSSGHGCPRFPSNGLRPGSSG